MKKVLLATAALAALLAPLGAQAETFAQAHPRRAEVLRRDNHQIRRDNSLARNGYISKGQARRLDREDLAIRRQEQRDAYHNGGHITRAQQAQLNREENRVNRQVRHDEWVDGTAR